MSSIPTKVANITVLQANVEITQNVNGFKYKYLSSNTNEPLKKISAKYALIIDLSSSMFHSNSARPALTAVKNECNKLFTSFEFGIDEEIIIVFFGLTATLFSVNKDNYKDMCDKHTIGYFDQRETEENKKQFDNSSTCPEVAFNKLLSHFADNINHSILNIVFLTDGGFNGRPTYTTNNSPQPTTMLHTQLTSSPQKPPSPTHLLFTNGLYNQGIPQHTPTLSTNFNNFHQVGIDSKVYYRNQWQNISLQMHKLGFDSCNIQAIGYQGDDLKNIQDMKLAFDVHKINFIYNSIVKPIEISSQIEKCVQEFDIFKLRTIQLLNGDVLLEGATIYSEDKLCNFTDDDFVFVESDLKHIIDFEIDVGIQELKISGKIKKALSDTNFSEQCKIAHKQFKPIHADLNKQFDDIVGNKYHDSNEPTEVLQLKKKIVTFNKLYNDLGSTTENHTEHQGKQSYSTLSYSANSSMSQYSTIDTTKSNVVGKNNSKSINTTNNSKSANTANSKPTDTTTKSSRFSLSSLRFW